jgi:hypothetical protein
MAHQLPKGDALLAPVTRIRALYPADLTAIILTSVIQAAPRVKKPPVIILKALICRSSFMIMTITPPPLSILKKLTNPSLRICPPVKNIDSVENKKKNENKLDKSP